MTQTVIENEFYTNGQESSHFTRDLCFDRLDRAAVLYFRFLNSFVG